MAEMIVDDPVLRKVAERLEGLYGDKLVALLLYGSRARGDHRPDSDYDVAVVVEDEATERAADDQLWRLGEDIRREAGANLSLRPFSRERLFSRTGFLHNLRKDAIPIELLASTPEPFRQRRPLRSSPRTMKPETTEELRRAREALDAAERQARYGEWPIVARESYNAVLHAARAVIFEAAGVRPKTHSGARSTFFDLGRDLRAINADTAAFLGRGYELKQTVDYGDRYDVGEDAGREALAQAHTFLAMSERMLAELEDARPPE